MTDDELVERTLRGDSAAFDELVDGLLYVSDWNAGLNVLEYEG